jgi:hypothetical protein
MATTEHLDLDGDGYHETVAGDYDGDGYLETIETDLDLDGDTDMAEVDTDLDGYTDTVIDYGTAGTVPFEGGEEWVVDGSYAVDYDGDGYAETIETDLDLDGVTDIAEIDTDLDGYTDTVVDLWSGEVYGTDAGIVDGCDGWSDEVYVEEVVTEEIWVDDSTAALEDYYGSQETFEMLSEMSESMHETNMEIIDNIDGVDDYSYETTYY